jgi:hypothetical protein
VTAKSLVIVKVPTGDVVPDTFTLEVSTSVPVMLVPLTVALMMLVCSRRSRSAPVAHGAPIESKALQLVAVNWTALAPAVPV